jgi:hypothetical protein
MNNKDLKNVSVALVAVESVDIKGQEKGNTVVKM